MVHRMKPNLILAILAASAFLGSMLGYSLPVLAEAASGTSQAVTDPVSTFGISFLIGISGAFVYLFILLITDRTLSILRNEILPLSTMVFLYTVSGGIVAGITQTAMGIGIAASNVHNVFMVGFGWQGVVSGAGGSSKVAHLKEEDIELKKLLEDIAPT